MLELLPDIKPVTVTKNPVNPSGYWKKQLADAPTRIEFFPDRFRSAVSTSHSSPLQFSLGKEYRSELNQLSVLLDAPLPIVLLSAFKILLYRLTNQTDLVVGYLNTDHPTNSGNVAENFEKILPIRTTLQKNPDFTALVQQVRKTVNAAAYYKDEVEADSFAETFSGPDKAVFHFPARIIFAFKNNSESISKNKNSYRSYDRQEGITDLRLTLENSVEGVAGVIEYNTELFEADTISRVIEYYQMLLHEIITDPAQKIAHIRLLTDAERNKLLVEWNKTETDFPYDNCVHQLFEKQVAITPQAVAAILHPNVSSTYNQSARQLNFTELDQRANQVAHYLQKLGVGPDVLVGVYMNRSLEMVIALLGILKAGGAYLPLDAGLPKDRLDFIFKDSGISILLSQHQLIHKLPTVETKIVCLDTEWDKISLHNSTPPDSKATPQNLAYVIYTSGSTGVPKGTLIIHKGVVNYLTWCIKAYHLAEGNGCPVNSSIGFDATVTSFIAPLLAGKKIVLLPEQGEIEALVDVLQANNKFSLIKITPAHLEILSNLLPYENTDGQTNALVIGGEALTEKNLRFWRKHAPATRLINEYGPTETVVGCCIYEASENKSLTGDIPIGRPIANTQIYILDNYMQPVPIGVAGEIYIGGAGLARGYLNRPELTLERFIANPFHEDSNARLYKTGDIGRYLSDGNIIFMGRADNQVKIRGYRVEPGEIEHALNECEPVKQAVVLAKEDEEGSKQLLGYYVPDPDILNAKARELQYQWVANWKEVYETEYGQANGDKNIDPEFNITGWNDSFTGQPIPAHQMKEWLDDIVDVVLAGAPENVLEIGCGTGLIYYRLADKIKKYIGNDLSDASIRQIKDRINKNVGNYCETQLFTAPAHQVMLPPGQQIDTVLLNSMVQYFPGEEYMSAVIKNCLDIVGSKGRIIIGDVRDNRLLELFKGRLRLQKSKDFQLATAFKRGLEQDIIKEEELCLSPGYFFSLKNSYPQITHIDIQWKKADYINELSLYRYTVIMHIGVEKERIFPQWQSWNEISNKKGIFSAHGEMKNTIAFRNVPNPRLWKEKLLQKALQNAGHKTVGDITQAIEKEGQEIVQLKQLLNLAESKGYSQKFFVNEDPLAINLLFEINPSHGFIQQPSSEKIQYTDVAKANIPLFNDITFLLQQDIRKTLLEKLPEYMVPSVLIAIRQVPLTTNGKVDHAALPVPNQQRQFTQKAFVAGRNKLEIELSKLFEKSMGIDHISVQDDVLGLGINSMQGYRIFAQIKKITGTQLPLSILLQAPTIEQLAAHLNRKESKAPWSSLIPIQPKGSRLPLYCIHAGGGTVLFYRELSKYLGEDQPVYGLQLQGLDGKQEFHKSVEEMAIHYINEIRTVNPEGPYLLGGFCFGAIVAFEMACQLTGQGYKVALLANFNGVSPAYINPKSKNPGIDENMQPDKPPQSIELYTRISRKIFLKKSAKEKISYLSEKFESRVINKLRNKINLLKHYVFQVYILALLITYKCCRMLGIKAPQAIRKYHFVFTNSGIAKAYKPKVYNGRLTIFRSPGIYHNPHLGWRKYVSGEIDTCNIPGRHNFDRQIMNEPFVEFTAKELERQINRYVYEN